MAMAELSTLLPLLIIPHCHDAMKLRALRQACNEFCDKTEIWEEALDAVSSVADQADYVITSPYENTVIKRVVDLKIDDVTLDNYYWSFSTDNSLSLSHAPTEDDKEIVATVVIIPGLLCNSVIDWLLARYGETIAAGAEFKLKSQAGTEKQPYKWYDPQGAALARQQFLDGITKAKRDRLMQRQSGHINVEQRQFV